MSAARALRVSLPADLAALVEAKVASGEYASEEEVVREGLRVLGEQDAAATEEALRTKVRAALDDPRPSLPAEEAFAEVRARHAARMVPAGDA